jgi:hypothetical protein
MSTGATVAIIVAIVIIAVVAFSTMTVRRRRLRQRFGPEYDRTVVGRKSQRKAEAELAGRERRVRKLDIRPLTAAAHAEYTAQWASIQERFVDQPTSAVPQAQQLVTAVLQDRGYPTQEYEQEYEQLLADLSVEHARNLEHYRVAHAISESLANGSASTEDLRQAMIHYRAMFDDLLGDLAGPGRTEPADRAMPDAAVHSNGRAAAMAESDSEPDSGSHPESDPAVAGPRAGEAPVVSQPGSEPAR